MILPLLLACAHSVDITLTGARIAPEMAGNTPWDGPQKLNPEAKGLFESALKSIDSGGKFAEIVGAAVGEVARPDVTGTLEFVAEPGAAPVTTKLPEVPDSLTPVWAPGPSTLKGVVLSGKSTLKVTLVDHDLSSDDPIGMVMLTTSQLCRAETMDGPLTLEVADQTSGQIETVSVLVVRSAP